MSDERAGDGVSWLVRIFGMNAALTVVGVVATGFGTWVVRLFVIWAVLVLSTTWTLGVYDQEVASHGR